MDTILSIFRFNSRCDLVFLVLIKPGISGHRALQLTNQALFSLEKDP